MKKLLTLLVAAAMFSVVACGPKTDANKAKEDSIKMADSLAKEQLKLDSIAKLATDTTKVDTAKAV